MVGEIIAIVAARFFAGKREDGEKQSVTVTFIKRYVFFREVRGHGSADAELATGVQDFCDAFFLDACVIGDVISREFDRTGGGVYEIKYGQRLFVCQQFEKLRDFLLLFEILHPGKIGRIPKKRDGGIDVLGADGESKEIGHCDHGTSFFGFGVYALRFDGIFVLIALFFQRIKYGRDHQLCGFEGFQKRAFAVKSIEFRADGFAIILLFRFGKPEQGIRCDFVIFGEHNEHGQIGHGCSVFPLGNGFVGNAYGLGNVILRNALGVAELR